MLTLRTGGNAPTRALPPNRATRRAVEDDRRWFARYPDRNIRLRDPAPGEVAHLTAGTDAEYPPTMAGYPLRLFVVRIGDGIRARRPLYCRLGPGTPEPVLDAFLRLVALADSQGYEGVLGTAELGAMLGFTGTGTRH